MSLSKHSRRQATRVSSRKSSSLKPSTPQAKVIAVHQVSPPHKHALPDSGFFESSDAELFPGKTDLPSSAYNNEDWVLFADENITYDDDYYFHEDDATDIASVKANHGSNYNGQNNEDNTLASSRSPLSSRRDHPLSVIYESPRRNEPPPHVFSDHATTQSTVTTLQTWVRTPEQHEIIAYQFEQPPNPHYAFREAQYYFDGEIDLSPYEVNN